MLDLIIDFAKNDKSIRAVLMNGSRVNLNVPKDIFQDYDIVNLVTDVEPFKNEKYIYSHFGETIKVQTPEDKIIPPAIDDGHYNYNMQFIDGNRIDLSFYHINKIESLLKDSLTEILLDKDNIIPDIPPSSERSYFIKKPTEKLYIDICDEFIFGIGSHIPKTIWRKELPLLKVYIEVVLRTPLIRMFGWEIGLKTGFNKSIGKAGKNIQKYLEPAVWNDFKKTYSDFNFDNIWESLFILSNLFRKSAEYVAQNYKYQFPEIEFSKALKFLTHVKNLPKDAKSIY